MITHNLPRNFRSPFRGLPRPQRRNTEYAFVFSLYQKKPLGGFGRSSVLPKVLEVLIAVQSQFKRRNARFPGLQFNSKSRFEHETN